MNLLGKTVAAIRLNWRTLRTQLALLYAGAFVALGAAVLGVLAVAGLLVRSGSTSVQGVTSSQNFFTGRQFRVGPALVFGAAVLIALAHRLAHRGPVPAAAADYHRDRTGYLGQQPEPTAEHHRPWRRIRPARRHAGRPARTTGGVVPGTTAFRGQCLARVAHPPDSGANVAAARARRSGRRRGDAAINLPAGTGAGEQQERLIDALLTLASSERGIEQWESFDLAEVATRAIMDRRQDADRRGIRIDASLDAAPTAGDQSLADSLVANLVDNAIRHNVDGGRVEISTVTADGQATLAIGNTGAVIPPGEVDRLFQPFQRLGIERTGHGNGLGLGLAIVRAIAGVHGATLTATARPHGGLDVTVTFPRRQQDA